MDQGVRGKHNPYPLILNLFILSSFSKGFITNKIYREINEVSHKTAHIDLEDLMQKGLLITTGKGRATKYTPRI
jgi:predicted HTH transcriptional regulator